MESNEVQKIDTPPFAVWGSILDSLKGTLDPQVFDAYIAPLTLVGVEGEGSLVTVGAPSAFLCSYVEKNFGDKIRTLLSERLGDEEIGIRFRLAPSAESGSTSKARGTTERFFAERPGADGAASLPYVVVKKSKDLSSNRTSNSNQLSISYNLNPRYTFESFVVGSSNQFCHAAAMRVAESPGASYNPLFIYGGVGLGKTHLLHAIGNAALKKNPRTKVLYMSSEAFTNELIASLRHARMDEFKKKMRGIEVLLIDDIQFMRGKERTQEEFFHTFNALYGAKHQIVITSDKLPSEIPGIEERLQTRFSWGLTADIQSPDFETRVAILKRKAITEQVLLPENVAHLIAEKISSNVRELEGALTRLTAVSSLQGAPLTLDVAENALKPLLQPRTVSLSIDDIKKAVSTRFNIKVSEIISKRRTKNLSFPRHIAMYLCRKHTTASYPEIGNHFGGRDHSSVIHAASVVGTKVKSDNEVKGIIDELEKILFQQ